MIEMMAQYQRATGLKALGAHRRLADEMLSRWRRTCDRCGGSGFVGEDDWVRCPICEGSGGFWSASDEALAAAYQAILHRYPEAGARGCLATIRHYDAPLDGLGRG